MNGNVKIKNKIMPRLEKQNVGRGLWAVVCPKQKIVKVMMDRTLVKTYAFKMDIPKVKAVKEKSHYDYGEWCVSERETTTKYEVIEYDKNVINKIKVDTLQYHKSLNS